MTQEVEVFLEMIGRAGGVDVGPVVIVRRALEKTLSWSAGHLAVMVEESELELAVDLAVGVDGDGPGEADDIGLADVDVAEGQDLIFPVDVGGGLVDFQNIGDVGQGRRARVTLPLEPREDVELAVGEAELALGGTGFRCASPS